jgi:hypothetical protein
MPTVSTSSVLDYADEVATKMGVDPSLAKSIILAENMGKSGKIPEFLSDNLTSPAGAYGVSQVMKDTHEGLKKQGYLPTDHNLDSWRGQVEAGVAALKAKSKEHRTNDPVVLAAAYNGGNNGAKLAINGEFDKLPPETKDYLNKIRIADNYVNSGSAPSTTRPVSASLSSQSPQTPQSSIRSVENQIDPSTFAFAQTGNPDNSRDTRPPTADLQKMQIGRGPEITDANGNPIDESTPQGRALIAITKGVEQNRIILEDLIKQTTNSTEEAASRARGAADALLVAGSFEGMAAEQRGAIEAMQAGMRARSLDIANLNTTKVNNAFANLLAERQSLQQAREPLRDEIDARMSVGFFDNPIEWLVNATVLPGQVNEYNSMVRKENDNVRQLTQLQNDVKAQTEIDLGATADLLLKQGITLKDATVAKARAESEKLRSTASGMIAQKVLNIASLRERVYADEERLERWRATFAEGAQKNALKAEQLADKKEIDRRLDIVGQMIGREGVSVDTLKGQGKAVQEAWMTRADTLRLGDEFPESFEFIRQFGDLNNMRAKGLAEFADMQRAFQQVIDQRATDLKNTWAQAHPELAAKPPSDVQARNLAARQVSAEWVAQKDNDMLASSQYNPYRINHAKGAKVFNENPNNPVYMLVNDAFKNHLNVDDRTLLESTRKLVETGKLQPREASQALYQYYSFMVEKNNNDRSLVMMGLDKETSYKVRMRSVADLPLGQVFGQPKTIAFDLLNPTSTENFFTLTKAASVARAQGAGAFDPSTYEIIPPSEGGGLRRKKMAPPVVDQLTGAK